MDILVMFLTLAGVCCGPVLIVMGIFTVLLFLLMRKYRANNDWAMQESWYKKMYKSAIKRAVSQTQIKALRNHPDEWNPSQPPFKVIGIVDFGDLFAISISEAHGIRDFFFPPPDRLVLIPTELVTHRHFLELVVDCNGWHQWADIYFPIPTHDQTALISNHLERYANWFKDKGAPIKLIMAFSNSLEAQAKAYSIDPTKKSMKDKMGDIAGSVKDGIKDRM